MILKEFIRSGSTSKMKDGILWKKVIKIETLIMWTFHLKKLACNALG